MKFITASQTVNGSDPRGLILSEDSLGVNYRTLAAGTDIPEHFSPDSEFVVPLTGKIDFTDCAHHDVHTITPGDFVRMYPGEHHALHAVEDSTVMIIRTKLAD